MAADLPVRANILDLVREVGAMLPVDAEWKDTREFRDGLSMKRLLRLMNQQLINHAISRLSF
jgi:hypothetical protein